MNNIRSINSLNTKNIQPKKTFIYKFVINPAIMVIFALNDCMVACFTIMQENNLFMVSSISIYLAAVNLQKVSLQFV